MVGTVAQTVTPSSSINRRALSGSNRPSGITSLMPARVPTTRLEWQPDTWNRGEVSSAVVRAPIAAPSAVSGNAMPMAIVLNSVFCRLATMLRCVDTAPLGRPVVPLV
jgi:hypothetical protein